MAQRFFNLVLLEKCREDIRTNGKLNYHLYMSLKKALFKPSAFYKGGWWPCCMNIRQNRSTLTYPPPIRSVFSAGILLPLAQSGTCSLREATIFGSVLAKVSIPGVHSAAVLLRLCEMPYSGSTHLFIKVGPSATNDRLTIWGPC